jgi:hypothetical protein
VDDETIDPATLDILMCIALNPVTGRPTVIYREERINLLTSVEFADVCTTVADLALEIAPFGIPDVLEMPDDD